MNNEKVLLLLYKYYLKIDKRNKLNTIISKFKNEYHNLIGGVTTEAIMKDCDSEGEQEMKHELTKFDEIISSLESSNSKGLEEIRKAAELEDRKKKLLDECDRLLLEKNAFIISLREADNKVDNIFENINKYTKENIIDELIQALDSRKLKEFFVKYDDIPQKSLMLFAQNHIYKYLDDKNKKRSTIKGECFDLVACGESSDLGKLHIESSYQHGISFKIDKFIKELEIILKITHDDKSEKRKIRLEFFQEINQLDQLDKTSYFGDFFTWICNVMNGGDGFNQYEGQPLIITVSGGNIYIIFAKLLLNLKKAVTLKIDIKNPSDELITINESVLSSFTQLYFNSKKNDDTSRNIIYEMIKKLSGSRLNDLINMISSSEYSDFDYKLLPNMFDEFRKSSEESIREPPTMEMTVDKTELIGLILDPSAENAEPGTKESSNLDTQEDIGKVYIEVPYEDRNPKLYPGIEGRTTELEVECFNKFLIIKKQIENLEKNLEEAGSRDKKRQTRSEIEKKKAEAQANLNEAKHQLANLLSNARMHADAIKLYNQELLGSSSLSTQYYENFEEFEEYDSTDGFLLSRCKFVLQYIASLNSEFDSDNEEIKNIFKNISEQIKQIAQIEHVYGHFKNPCTDEDIQKLGISRESMYAQMAQQNWLMIEELDKDCEMYIEKLISTKKLIAYSTTLFTKIIVEIFQKQNTGTRVLFHSNFDDFEKKILSYKNYGGFGDDGLYSPDGSVDGILLYLHYISNRQNKYIKSYVNEKFNLSWNQIYLTEQSLQNQFRSLDTVLTYKTSKDCPFILPLLLKDLVVNFSTNPEFKTKKILDYIVEYINRKNTYVKTGISRYELVRTSYQYKHLQSLLSEKIQSIPGLMIFVNAIKF